jgi:type IV pilus assembly protein PilX
MNNLGHFSFSSKQRGVVLITVLVFLVALTLLALTSMRGSTIGERAARNNVDKLLATQAAEAALRDAQADILWQTAAGVSCVGSPSNPLCRTSSERPIIGDPVNRSYNGDGSCTRGQCYVDPTIGFTTPVWLDTTKWANGVVYGGFTGAAAIPSVSRQPVYLIEGFQFNNQWKIFRISAMGYGADQNTQVLLQSIFVPKF